MVLFIFELLLFLSSLFLILIVLVQRGRGGGLSGALGGMGGQSAFGAKAGDVFTRITVITAIFWIMLSLLTIKLFNAPIKETKKEDSISAPGDAGAGADIDGTGDAAIGDDGVTGDAGTSDADENLDQKKIDDMLGGLTGDEESKALGDAQGSGAFDGKKSDDPDKAGDAPPVETKGDDDKKNEDGS